MSAGGRSWDDLRPRIVTGVALALGGVVVVVAGGTVFALTAALAAAIMVWEIARMVAPDRGAEAMQLAVLAAAAILLARVLPGMFTFPLLAAPALVGAGLLRAHQPRFALYAFAVLLACFGLVWARDNYGMIWLVWLVVTVAVTDIAGYFAGKAIGGPKFWPSISPKKTWAGIVAGWIAAALVSVVFFVITDAGRDLFWIAACLSFASQMGDTAESSFALSRHP